VSRFLVLHVPHLALALGAFVVVLVSAVRAERHGDPGDGISFGAVTAAPPVELQRTPRPVSPRIARLGLLALAPLGLVLVSGVLLYALDASGQRPGEALRIGHAVVATLALAQVIWKVGAIGARRLRATLQRTPGTALASLALATLGVALLLAPSSASTLAYAHLIAAAWWTALLGAHLLRHLPRALAIGPR
jgi:hypothetical protein